MKPNLLIAGLLLCGPCHTLSATQQSDSISVDSIAHALNEIVVKGQRPMAKMSADGFTVNVQNSYLSHSGTAFDLLGKMPLVIAQSGSLNVLGKGAPIVYVNGRRLYDLSELEQLQSDQIKKVEVITAPGARYDGSVNAVIRLTTIAPVGEGFSLNDRTTVGYKHYAYLFENLGLNWRQGGFDAFAQLNYEAYRARGSYSTRTDEYLTGGKVTKDINGLSHYDYPLYNGRAGLNFTHPDFSAGAFYDFNFRPLSSTSESTTFRTSPEGSENITNTGDSRSHDRRHQLSAYATGTFGKWELAANFDAIWIFNDADTRDTDISDIGGERRFSTANPVTNRFYAANAVADFKFWKGSLSFGGEWNSTWRDDIYMSDAEYIPSSDTHIDETNGAAFGEITQTFGNLSVKAGLRWEHSSTTYTLDGKRQDDRSRTYSQFFPSASIGYTVGRVGLRASYGHRTSRPIFEQLSSTVRYQDRYTYEAGNPYLKPVYRDFVSLSSQWSNLYAEIGYRSTKNYIMWQTGPYDAVPGATLSQQQNMPRFGTIWAVAHWAPTFGPWHPVAMAGIEAPDFTIEHNGQPLKLNKPMGIFRFNNSVQLPAGVWIDVNFSATTSGNAENIYMKSKWGMNLAAYKSFLSDNLSVRLEFNDVFNTMRSDFTIFDALTRLHTVKTLDTRELQLTVRYKFNVARSRYRGTGAGTDDQQRL